MRIIDLYSGVSGWHMGFKLAGLDIVQSYEWWNRANRTHNMNFSTDLTDIDIRQLKLEDLPNNIDIVIGSPPCTQFSYANRGGNGDIEDGLKDIQKYLEVIEYLAPKYWVMENVPRVASIIEKEISIGGSLEHFAYLFTVITVVNTEEYGVPQARKRMLAGNFPYELLKSYKGIIPTFTMGEVISSLKSDPVVDILYGIKIPKSQLTENTYEEPLNEEEARMNREAKMFHPVYNSMNFPDLLTRPSRTITGTCTKVSRESIVVNDTRKKNTYRRLTLRESALLQSFPITFQFYGNSYTDKLKMIGNAFPPIMAYCIAHSIIGTKPEDFLLPSECQYKHPIPEVLPEVTSQNVKVRNYNATRRFRAAIPNLRFGSGVRFELVNNIKKEPVSSELLVSWNVDFYYGSSKDIQTVNLDMKLLGKLKILTNYKHLEKILSKYDYIFRKYFLYLVSDCFIFSFVS